MMILSNFEEKINHHLMNIELKYKKMTADDFQQIITLGTYVHGDGYIDDNSVEQWFNKGIKGDINASYVVYHNEKLVGFRLTFAADQWQIDQWCSAELWQKPTHQVCYFKCNTVDENYRGHGIGGKLLALSIKAASEQGATAGVSHLWRQSPGNSAVKYFTKCGGELVKNHPDRWNELSKNGYNCPLCGFNCHCEAAEMIIHFDH